MYRKPEVSRLIPINWFNSCHDSSFAGMTLALHKSQVRSSGIMQYWACSSLTSAPLPAEEVTRGLFYCWLILLPLLYAHVRIAKNQSFTERSTVLFKNFASYRVVVTLTWYAIALNNDNLSGNRLLNIFFAGVTELVSSVLYYFGLKLLGRRNTYVGLMATTGVAVATAPVVAFCKYIFKCCCYLKQDVFATWSSGVASLLNKVVCIRTIRERRNLSEIEKYLFVVQCTEIMLLTWCRFCLWSNNRMALMNCCLLYILEEKTQTKQKRGGRDPA